MAENSPDSPFRIDGDGVKLYLHVHPGAKRSGFNGKFGNACKVDLQSPPVDGKANAELIRFLAAYFGLPKSSVSLLSGASGRDKSVHISGITLEKANKILQ